MEATSGILQTKPQALLHRPMERPRAFLGNRSRIYRPPPQSLRTLVATSQGRDLIEAEPTRCAPSSRTGWTGGPQPKSRRFSSAG